MSTYGCFGVALLLVSSLGCEDKERMAQLEKELVKVQDERLLLDQEVSKRDQYIVEVVDAIDKVYGDLEAARSKEAGLLKRSVDAEGNPSLTNETVRKAVLEQIGTIHTSLKKSRTRIAGLQKRLKESDVKYGSLDEMVANLKQTLEQRERSVAQLQATVVGLEQTVAENVASIREKEEVIARQVGELNKAYYVVGEEEELKQNGIIDEEGGILWGLAGTTTVMASGVNVAHFTPLDKRNDQTIRFSGHAREILPRRSTDYFALNQNEDGGGDLTITRPDLFWQDRFLVIVVD